MGLFENALEFFWLGVLTPLTAVCVIPLYPAFLARMARQAQRDRDDRRTLALYGLVVTAGVISFMAALGIIFTTVLQQSIQAIIGIVSPIAFAILFVIGVLLVAGVHLYQKVRLPEAKNPLVAAFVYGFFFSAQHVLFTFRFNLHGQPIEILL